MNARLLSVAGFVCASRAACKSRIGSRHARLPRKKTTDERGCAFARSPSHYSRAPFHFFFNARARALLPPRPDSIISPHPSLGLVSGFVESRLARATLWYRVPLIEGMVVSEKHRSR